MKLSSRIAVWALEDGVVRVALVYTGGKRPAVLESHTATYSNEDDERFESAVQAIRDVTKKMKGKAAAHVLMADSRQCIARLLSVPFRGKRRVASAVTFELEPHLAVPVDELTVDHIFVREVDEESEVLALGLRTQDLAERVAIMNAAGVAADGIGLDVAGLTALLNGQRGKNPGLQAALHVNEHDSLLTVTQSKTLAYFRFVTCGSETLISDPERTAREVQNTLRAFLAKWRGDTEVSGLTITGIDLPHDARERFESGIAAPVTYADLLGDVKDGNKIAEHAGPVAAAAMAGVAMAAAGDGPDVNFAKGELVTRGIVNRFASHMIISGALTAVLLCAFLFYAITTYRQRIEEIESIGDEIWSLYDAAFPNSDRVKQARDSGTMAMDVGGNQALQQMEEEATATVGPRGSMSLDVLARPTLLTLLDEISRSLPGNQVTITSVMVRSSRDRSQEVIIQGDVSAQAVGAVNAMFDKMKESQHMELAIDRPMTSIREEQATFTITART